MAEDALDDASRDGSHGEHGLPAPPPVYHSEPRKGYRPGTTPAGTSPSGTEPPFGPMDNRTALEKDGDYFKFEKQRGR